MTANVVRLTFPFLLYFPSWLSPQRLRQSFVSSVAQKDRLPRRHWRVLRSLPSDKVIALRSAFRKTTRKKRNAVVCVESLSFIDVRV